MRTVLAWAIRLLVALPLLGIGSLALFLAGCAGDFCLFIQGRPENAR